MTCIWLRILERIDYRNNLLQARNASVDVEVDNLRSLVQDLKMMATQWPDILTDAEDITKSMDATPEFPEKRKQTENQKELILQFKENVFMKVLNSVNEGMENRFTAVN